MPNVATEPVAASDWAAGFLDAVALRAKAWEPLINHRQAKIMLAPVFVLDERDHSQGGL
jgi:hypothetical protein